MKITQRHWYLVVENSTTSFEVSKKKKKKKKEKRTVFSMCLINNKINHFHLTNRFQIYLIFVVNNVGITNQLLSDTFTVLTMNTYIIK